MTVLVLEDNKESRRALGELLHKISDEIEVELTATKEEALEADNDTELPQAGIEKEMTEVLESAEANPEDLDFSAFELGLNLIDAGHFYTENPVTEYLAEKLREAFPQVEVKISETHDDCVKFY